MGISFSGGLRKARFFFSRSAPEMGGLTMRGGMDLGLERFSTRSKWLDMSY